MLRQNDYKLLQIECLRPFFFRFLASAQVVTRICDSKNVRNFEFIGQTYVKIVCALELGNYAGIKWLLAEFANQLVTKILDNEFF